MIEMKLPALKSASNILNFVNCFKRDKDIFETLYRTISNITYKTKYKI